VQLAASTGVKAPTAAEINIKWKKIDKG